MVSDYHNHYYANFPPLGCGDAECPGQADGSLRQPRELALVGCLEAREPAEDARRTPRTGAGGARLHMRASPSIDRLVIGLEDIAGAATVYCSLGQD